MKRAILMTPYFLFNNQPYRLGFLILLLAMLCGTPPCLAQQLMSHSATSILAASPAPDLDLRISHYIRLQTAEGDLQETRYEENMLRRQNHVWMARVLPKAKPSGDSHHAATSKTYHGVHITQATIKTASVISAFGHRHLNPALLARHMTITGGKMMLEFIDAERKEIISVAPGEYDTVHFNGSWSKAYYLLAPEMTAALFTAQQASPATGTRWLIYEKDDYFQRVLWDEKRKIALITESGNRSGTYYQRTETQVSKNILAELPWQQTQAFSQKKYVDFLD